MQYALIDGQKVKADPQYKGKKGTCQYCESILNLRLPIKKIHHWYHEPHPNCDHWWEVETQWHRDWKNHFPNEWREVIQKDPLTGEKHIADVKAGNGLVIEFQNSPISSEEIISRETFYQKMVWVVNGHGLIDHFNEYSHSLKSNSKFWNIDFYCKDKQMSIDFCNLQIKILTEENYKRKERINYPKRFSSVKQDIEDMMDTKLQRTIERIEAVERLIDFYRKDISNLNLRIQDAKDGKVDLSNGQKENWDLCFSYSFTNRRRNWEDAKKQIFLDIDGALYLRKYDLDQVEYYKKVTKEEFVQKVRNGL